MILRNAASNGNSYRNRRHSERRPAPGAPGTLRQQLAALSDFLQLQDHDRLTGFARERRWEVVHAIHTEQPIPLSYTKEAGQ